MLEDSAVSVGDKGTRTTCLSFPLNADHRLVTVPSTPQHTRHSLQLTTWYAVRTLPALCPGSCDCCGSDFDSDGPPTSSGTRRILEQKQKGCRAAAKGSQSRTLSCWPKASLSASTAARRFSRRELSPCSRCCLVSRSTLARWSAEAVDCTSSSLCLTSASCSSHRTDRLVVHQ